MIMENKNSESDNLLAKCIADFGKIIKQPADFLCEQPPQKCSNIRKFLEQMYGITVKNDVENVNNLNIMPELVVEDMDEEQIWQQLEMRNEHVLNQLNEETARLLNLPEENLEIRLNEDDTTDEENSEEEHDENLENDSEGEEDEHDDDDDDDDEEDNDDQLKKAEQNDNEKNYTKKGKKSIVDDKFFKLSEMTKFLEQEDARELRKQKGKMLPDDINDIDYFAENPSDDDDDNEEGEEEHAINYKDFFGDADELDEANDSGTKHVKKDYFAANDDEEQEESASEATSEKDEQEKSLEEEADEDEENENENNNEEQVVGRHMEPASDNSESEQESDGEDVEKEEKPKSNFEMRQERLHARIRDYEEEVLGEKPWQLKGEIQATNRPQNSLLEEILEFESTIRPAPVITEETTQRLEDIIRQRIKDQAWDDVELKVRPQQTPQEYRKQLVLDQEKSKQSLAQVYESEYQSELNKLDPNREEANAEEKPEHKEIKRLMNELFIKLDALSNFHFVPKPLAPEAKIITNTPAVNMEEVAPVAVSDAKLLAPEEIYRGAKHEPMGKSERTRTDKNRERRKKKQKQRAINKVIELKDIRRQKLGIPLSKKEESAKLMKTITKHRNVEKISASNDKAALKSSRSFFNQLQDQTTNSANGKNNKMTPGKRSQDGSNSKNVSAKKMKL